MNCPKCQIKTLKKHISLARACYEKGENGAMYAIRRWQRMIRRLQQKI